MYNKVLRPRIRFKHPAQEEDAPGRVVADEEEEGVVGTEGNRHRFPLYMLSRGGGSLGTFLVDVDKRLVQNRAPGDLELGQGEQDRAFLQVGKPSVQSAHPQAWPIAPPRQAG